MPSRMLCNGEQETSKHRSETGATNPHDLTEWTNAPHVAKNSLQQRPCNQHKSVLAVLVLHRANDKKHPLPNHPLRLVASVSASSQFSRLTPARVCANGYPGSSPRRS